TTCQVEEPPHSVFETGADDQPIIQTSQHPEWFSQPRRPPSPDRAWNKTLPAAQGDAQSWISDLARKTDARSSFNELLNTPIDFSNFIMHRLNIDTLAPDLLAGPTYELMRGSSTNRLQQARPLGSFSLGAETLAVLWEQCHQKESGRSSTGSGKLPEEAQPYEVRHVPTRSEATDGTLNDVRNALDDRLKEIRMQYLPTTIWRRVGKDRAAAMIQAIEKMLKTRRIMRSLEK
nr:hypothetical protein [Tanacetum cinerariifolium]